MDNDKYLNDFNCYDCGWSSDKCKNKDSNQYDNFIHEITCCNLAGKMDNSYGYSIHKLFNGKDDSK